MFPDRKQMGDPLEEVLLGFEDPKFSAQMQKFFTSQAVAGVNLAGLGLYAGLDLTNAIERAKLWAEVHAGEFITGIDETTLERTMEAVQDAIIQFVETPGFTIGDVVARLPFEEERGLMIAITEITRTYATGAQLAGEELQQQFPDVRVIKTWWTNADGLVCDYCRPLHRQSVLISEQFYNDEMNVLYDHPEAHVNCRCWMEESTDILEEVELGG
jgi:hypothetical protein